MFLEHYGLREQPFGVTPDPRFIYFGAAHREALASLLYAIETKRGFSAIVAQPGMGKTSLLFHLLDSLRDSARTAFLFQTDGDSKDFLRCLLTDMGIKTRGKSIAAMHGELNQTLIEEARAGRKMIVVVDEAQNLDEGSLESVRLLSNFETSTEKLLHVVLAGQPKLADKLASSNLEQLRQRVSNIIRIGALSPAETVQYIEHRLRVAGYEGSGLFSTEALDLVARVSKGIPRNINSVCFQALSTGFALDSAKIGADIVREVAADLDVSPRSHRPVQPTPAPSWPAQWPASEEATRTFDPQPGHRTARVRPRSIRGRGTAIVLCVAFVLVSVLAFSDPSLGLTKTVPGRISAHVVNAILSSADSSSDFLPAPPKALKPPAAPSVEITQPEAAPPPTDGGDSLMASESKDSQDVEAPATETKASPGESSTRETEPGSTARRRRNSREHLPRTYGNPTRVRVERRENLFEFSLENLGKSNWALVEKICELNPQIRGPYDMLSTGQWIQLPAMPAAFTPSAALPSLTR